MSFDALSNLDPTGILSATGAAVSLVGTVLRTVPALKSATGAGGPPQGPNPTPGTQPALQRSQSGPANVAASYADPERERRAYETVNYVLREFGGRLCAGGFVDERALATALTGATRHIEVKLFSVDANRLFESLGSKLGDPILVNSVFTSIYLIGALTAELTSSLPNYKESYVPIGPRLVQQLFQTAIGEDAFRENLTANLDAYKTLATTAGLLRPTDIGYSTFPGFPSFSPSRYSSKSFGDVRRHKGQLETLVKHFDKFGFPQPNPFRAPEVGAIRDWRFLAGDANSRTFEVERTDKHVGENFGRVLHWLVCSAERIPAGVAVIAYHDQHIELIKWMGQRMGFSLLHAATELDRSGPHEKLDKKASALLDTFVVLMSSETAQTARRDKAAQWNKSQMDAQAASARLARSTPVPLKTGSSEAETMYPTATEIGVTKSQPPAAIPTPAVLVQGMAQVPSSPAKTAIQRLDELETELNGLLVPQCQRFLKEMPKNEKSRESEYKRLTEAVERNIILKMDELQTQDDEPARLRRKMLIIQAQRLIDEMDAAVSKAPYPLVSVPGVDTKVEPVVTSRPVLEQIQFPSANVYTPTTQRTPLPQSPAAASPPPYSPTTPSSMSSTTADVSSIPSKRASVIRRKAPPRPKIYPVAKALYDFEPEEGNEEELAFRAGDDIEIVEKSAALDEEGWCRARIKGSAKVGLAPLEYLDEAAGTSGSPASLSRSITTSSETKPPMPQISEAGQAEQVLTDSKKSEVGTAATYYDTTKPLTPPTSPQAMTGAMTSASPSDRSVYPPGHTPLIAIPSPNHQANMGRVIPSHTTARHPALESAGLAIAGVGAAASVAAVVQGTRNPPFMNAPADTPADNPTNQSNANEQPQTQDPTAQNADESTNTWPEQTTSDIPTTDPGQTAGDPGNLNMDNSSYAPPAATDLSSFNGSTYLSQEPNPVAGLAAIDPYYASLNPEMSNAPDFESAMAATAIPQAPAGPTDMGLSPLAGLALVPPDAAAIAGEEVYACDMASPLAGLVPTTVPPPEWPELVGEQSPPVTEMTQQSTEAVISNAEWTNEAAQSTEEYTSYEMGEEY